MRTLGLILAALCLAAAPTTDVAADCKSLQGTWTATTVEKSGKKIEGATIQVAVKDDTLKLLENGNLLAVATFRLQVEGQSRLIDLSFSEGSIKGMRFEGIYALKGDVLKICFALKEKERPSEFTSPLDAQSTLLVLRRDKP